MTDVDVVVIGAGVIGIAAARALALSGRSVILVEGTAEFGSGASSRNSEIIHAGIYYAPDSLKARLCVAGREMLYSFCADRGIAHRRTGKLIFAANDSQVRDLEALIDQGALNGVTDLTLLERREARRLEPLLDCSAAIISPSTGIVDSHAFMLAMLGELEASGGLFVARSPVSGIRRAGNEWKVYIDGIDGPSVTARQIVNSAGIAAQQVASTIDGLDARHIPKLHLARGVYFSYSRPLPYGRPIYPVPEPGGLGIHLTFDLAHSARFGPNVEWTDTPDYRIDESAKAQFVEGARRICRGIDPARLQPAYVGLRAKLSGPGMPAADFVISGPSDHGVPGLVNLFGIESPGLTASLAIGEHIVSMLPR